MFVDWDQVALYCYTYAGPVCPMRVAVPVGSPCTCYYPDGALTGVADKCHATVRAEKAAHSGLRRIRERLITRAAFIKQDFWLGL